MSHRLFLSKTSANDRAKNDKLPYFRLVLIPEEEGGEWINLGAFWKAKSGNGYTGKTEEGVVIDATAVQYNRPATEASPEVEREAD